MTQVYKYRAEVGSNWKLFIDAFAEFYHAPILHAKQATAEESRKLSARVRGAGLQDRRPARHGVLVGRHVAPEGPEHGQADRAGRCGVASSDPGTGPTSRLEALPPAVNPARHPAWGVDSFVFFPNFMLLVWQPNWYLTYHYWPTSYNTHVFEGTLYFVPPKNAANGCNRSSPR